MPLPKPKKVIVPNQNRVPGTCGIYEIVHGKSKRRYVGSSSNVEKRACYHLIMLKAGKHHCSYLQRVWSKYEGIGFRIYLIETCDVDSLVSREQYHIDKPSKYALMNSAPQAGSVRGFKHTLETKEKMSIAALDIADNPEESRRRSHRVKKQHAEGKLGRHGLRPLSPKKCKKCGAYYPVGRRPDGKPMQSKYCPKCRPPVHHGGYYHYK